LVVEVLAAVLVLGVGVHFLHAFQVSRSARGLLEQAIEAENAGKKDVGKKDVGKKDVGKKDVDALARFALALDKKKSDRDRFRALQVMQQVLRLDESRNDVRRRLVDTAIYLKRYQDAAEQIEKLLNPGPEDVESRAELEELLTRCHEAIKRLNR